MKDIDFVYLNEYAYEVCERPKPAAQFIPDWHKKMSNYAPTPQDPSGNSIDIKNFDSNASAKKCIPMRDAITAGYIAPLWSDILLDSRNDDIQMKWKVSDDVFSYHDTYGADQIPPPPGYSNKVFKFITHFRVETPRGYSVMILPPAGHYQLPFHAIPAIIDSDKSVMDFGIPVWVRENYSGIVEKGTPIAQLIPFKRDDWQSKFSMIPLTKWSYQVDKYFQSTLVNNYFKNFWSRKTFR